MKVFNTKDSQVVAQQGTRLPNGVLNRLTLLNFSDQLRTDVFSVRRY